MRTASRGSRLIRAALVLLAGVVIALVGVVAWPGAASALDVGQWQGNPATGHYYRQVDNVTWAQAEAYAVSIGGHLVTINDQAEQDWLEATFTQPSSPGDPQPLRTLWIGFNDRAVEGTWVWSSGEPVTYTHWQPYEPNNGCTLDGICLPWTENAAQMNWTKIEQGWVGWNDFDENRSDQSGIVEVPGASEQAADLTGIVDSYDLGKLGKSLNDELVRVQRALNPNKKQHTEQACKKLDSFLHDVQAQTGKKKGLTMEQATELTTRAEQIKTVIGC